eukprot:c18939_g1_i6.p1 GENE.c18939_g1_i6~~c18939_g1_i6.p1  ORF type:complete len:140 (+),score=17.32 c18939_g1_i6:550-969(+)
MPIRVASVEGAISRLCAGGTAPFAANFVQRVVVDAAGRSNGSSPTFQFWNQQFSNQAVEPNTTHRPEMKLAIAAHFCPSSRTFSHSKRSSSGVHKPRLMLGSSTLRQRSRHWRGVLVLPKASAAALHVEWALAMEVMIV